MSTDAKILIDDEMALDEERMSELAGDFSAALQRISELRLRSDARFVLAHGAVERLSAASPTPKARYRVPLQVSFLPPPGAWFARAHLVINLETNAGLEIIAVRPSQQKGEVRRQIEDTVVKQKGLELGDLKLGGSHTARTSYEALPVTIRGIGPGSDTAEWTFDGHPEEGGLPTRVDLELDVALLEPRLAAAIRMAAAVKWQGPLGVLPFAWPRGSFTRDVEIVLPRG